MASTRIEYDDNIVLECTENNKILKAEILDYRPADMLTCSVDRQIKIFMRYNTANKNYVGNVGKLEFVTNGPTRTVIKQGRY